MWNIFLKRASKGHIWNKEQWTKRSRICAASVAGGTGPTAAQKTNRRNRRLKWRHKIASGNESNQQKLTSKKQKAMAKE